MLERTWLSFNLLHSGGANFAAQKHVDLGTWPIFIHGKQGPVQRTAAQYCSAGALATALGDCEVVERCLDHRLSLDEPCIYIQREWFDDSPSERSQRLENIGARISHESKSTLLVMAASHLDHSTRKLLLRKGADAMAVESKYYDGYDAIFYAAKSGRKREYSPCALQACISILQYYGADIDAQDNKGASVLMKAVEWYQHKHSVVNTLLELGALDDAVDKKATQRSCLHLWN